MIPRLETPTRAGRAARRGPRTASRAIPAVLALIAALAVPAAAQEDGPLTLLDAARRALDTHPSVSAAEAAVDAAGAARSGARAAWWPSLALDASATRFEEPMPVYPIHGFTLDPAAAGKPALDPTDFGLPPFERTLYEARAGARWTVFQGGARLARTRRADALADAAEADLHGARSALLAGVTGAYLDVIVARDVLDAHDRRLDAMAAERDRVALAIDEGAAAKVDLARVDAAVARARADRVDAAARLDVAAGDLARFLGSEDPTDRLAAAVTAPSIAVEPTAPRSSPLEVPDRGPRVERARAEARAAGAAADAARAAWLPTVTAGGAYVERGAAGVDAWDGEWQAGLALEYPLFTGGARKAEVDRARAEASAARARARAVELDAAAALQRADAALERALARREALEAAVAGFEEVARVEALALEVGSGVEADWLDARADLLEGRAALAEARAAVVRAAVERARVDGTLSIEWLESRLEEAP